MKQFKQQILPQEEPIPGKVTLASTVVRPEAKRRG